MSRVTIRTLRPLDWRLDADGTTRLRDPRRGTEVRMQPWTAAVLEALDASPSLEAALDRAARRPDAPKPERVRRLILDLEKAGYLRVDVERPERLGRWTVEKELGRGAVGVAYLCEGGAVAKRAWGYLYPQRATNALVAWEGEVLRRLDHAGVVRALDSFDADGASVLVRTLAPGASLTELHDGKPATPERALALGRRVAEVVAHLHARGLLLVDGKPGNVFADGDRVALADAGNCLGLDGRGPDGVTPGGSRGFTPPERTPSLAADAWAVGRLVAFCATGKLTRGDVRLADLLDGLPAEVAPLVRRLCADEPDARPREALDLF